MSGAGLPGVVLATAAILFGCAGSSSGGPAGLGGEAGDPAATTAEAGARGERAIPEPGSAFGSYLAARHARRHSDTAAAARYYMRALEDDPANPELLTRALMATVAERAFDQAVGIAERLVEIDPDASVAVLTLAVEAMARGDPEAATDRLDTMPTAGFNRYLVPLLKGWTWVGRGDVERALAELAPLAETSVFASTHDFHSGLIAELAGREQAAENGYAGTLSGSPRGSLRAVLAAGGFYQRTGRLDEARAIYDAYLEDNPDTTFLDTVYRELDAGEAPPLLVSTAAHGLAEAFYGVAGSLYQENAFEPVLVYTQLALTLRPDLDAGHMLLGDVLSAVGRHEESVAAYDRVPEDSPLFWAVRLRAAGELAQLDRVDAAAGELSAMARERPARPDPLVSLGDLMRSEERWEEAVEAYDQAFARIPALEQRHWTLLYARGMSLERSKQWERAEVDFLRALELEPDQPLVLNYLGYSWVELGMHLDRAREMIEKAVDQRPSDGYIVDSLGWVLYQLGDFDEAARHLERAAELRPNDPIILDHFGDGLWRVDRREEARFQWRRALSFDPDPELAETIRRKIEQGLLMGEPELEDL
jgi:tetratricopeptide (TPR) repeat protein